MCAQAHNNAAVHSRRIDACRGQSISSARLRTELRTRFACARVRDAARVRTRARASAARRQGAEAGGGRRRPVHRRERARGARWQHTGAAGRADRRVPQWFEEGACVHYRLRGGRRRAKMQPCHSLLYVYALSVEFYCCVGLTRLCISCRYCDERDCNGAVQRYVLTKITQYWYSGTSLCSVACAAFALYSTLR